MNQPTIDLTDRVCIITGAAQGIGRYVAEGFVRRGAKVIATDLQPPDVQGAAHNAAWDVADPGRAEAVMHEAVQKFGRVDALVTNAAMITHEQWHEVTPKQCQQLLDVNVAGTWHGMQAAARVMAGQKYGKIVTVSSIQVVRGDPRQVPYAATKAAVISLTRSMARAVGRDGIRVNSVMPGAIWTRSSRQKAGDKLPQFQARWADYQCIPAPLGPEDLEPTFAFLCSSASDAITGQVICVDHGAVHW